MDKKKGIIIAIILLLLLSVGTFAFTREDESKLKDQDVSDQTGNNNSDNQDTPTSGELETPENNTNVLAPNTLGGNTGINNQTVNVPVFTLDDIKVDSIEFASSFLAPEKTMEDVDGTTLTAVITYEYREDSEDEFEPTDVLDTNRAGEYRITYTMTNGEGGSSSQSFVLKVVDTTDPEISGAPTETTNEDVELIITELNDYEITVNGETYTGELLFTTSGKYEVVVTDAVGNEATVTFTIDKDAPEAEVTKSNNDKSTNQDVTVTIIANEEIQDIADYWTKVDEKTYTRVYSEDGKYSVTIKDKAGNETVVKFEVKRIDKVAPEAEVIKSNDDKSTNQDVTVTIVANEAIYKPEGWTEVSTNKEHEFTKVYSENGKYSVTIKDKAGNETVIDFEVKGIDKTPAEASYTLSNNGKRTNQDVTVTIIANEAIKDVEGWTRVDEMTISKVFSANTTETVVIVDLAGNETPVEYTVKDISTTIPEAKENGVVYSTTDPTNGNVTVTIDATKPILVPEGWERGNRAYRITKVFEANAEEIVELKDLYGNVGSATVTVNNIDKIMPEVLSVEQEYQAKQNGRFKITITFSEPVKAGDSSSYSTTYVTYLYMNGKSSKNVNFQDKAGNSDSVTVTVDKTIPTGTVTYTPDGDTNGNVVVTMTTNKAIQTPEGWTKVNDTTFTKEYTENKTETVEIKDLVGLPGTVDVAVTNIDLVPPTLTIKEESVGTDPYFSQISFALSDNNKIDKFTVNGEEFDRTDAQYSDANYVNIKDALVAGENTIVLYDTAGNKTEKTFYMDWTNPTVTVKNWFGQNPYSGADFKLSDNYEIDYFEVNGTKYDRTNAKYSDANYVNIKNSLINGENTLVLYDAAGNSKTYTFTLERIAPTITVSDGTIGNNPYKKLNLKFYDASGVASVVINGTELPHTGYYVDINDGHAYTFQEGVNTVAVTDKAGNTTTGTFVVDRTHYVYTFEDLKAAFEAGGTAKVMSDVEIEEMLVLVSGKELVLDMNSHKLTISDTVDPMMDIKNGSKITLTGNGTFDLEDHKYASLMFPRGEVIIENGNFLRASGSDTSEYGSYFVGISGSGGTAKIRIYGGYFDGGYYKEGDEFNNSRNMLNGSWGQDIKIYGGTFVGQNPAYGDEGMAHTNPNSTSTYCQTLFFEGQSRLDTEIPEAYTVTKGTLADGRPTYTVTYDLNK